MGNPFAVLRTLRAFQQNALTLFTQAGMYPAGVVELNFGVTSAFVVADPTVATAVLTSPDFVKGGRPYGPFGTFAGFGSLRGLIGPSLPVLDGEEGLERRRRLTPVYTGVVDRLAGVTARSALVFPPLDGARVDLYPVLSQAIFERFCAVMFGRSYPEWAARVSDAVSTATTTLDVLSKSFRPYAGQIGPDARSLRHSRGVLLEFAAQVLADLRDTPDAAILPLLDAGLDPTQVLDEVLTQIVAGTETTTITACWALSLLTRHPEVGAAVRRGDDPGLLDRVVKETLRLYPAFWTMIRVPRVEAVVEGWRFPKNAVLFVSPWCIHHNPAVWPDPETFRPERFVPGAPGVPGEHSERARGAFMPFGYGARACIGARLAQGLLQDCVGQAAAQLELTFVDDEPDGHTIDPLIVVLKSRTGFHFRARSRATTAPTSPT